MCVKHLLPGNTHRTPKNKNALAGIVPTPATHPKEPNPMHTQHTPKRAKRCSVSPCPSQRTPLTNHPTNLSWVCAVYRTLPCSPAEGKACINQITTPGNDDHKEMPTRQRKERPLRRVQNTAGTIGVPLRLWGMGCGDSRHRGPAGWWEEAKGWRN